MFIGKQTPKCSLADYPLYICRLTAVSSPSFRAQSTAQDALCFCCPRPKMGNMECLVCDRCQTQHKGAYLKLGKALTIPLAV